MKRARWALVASWLLACRSETGGTADFTPVDGYGGMPGGSAGTLAGGAGNSGGGASSSAGTTSNTSGAGGTTASSSGGSSGTTGIGEGGASGESASGSAGMPDTAGSAGIGGGASGSGGTAGAGGGASGSSGAGGLPGSGGSAGNAGSGGSTGVVETAFLMNTLVLRDPHTFVNLIGCNDVTDTVNGQVGAALITDANNDGYLDFAPVVLFSPLNQAGGGMTPVDLLFGNCTAPFASTSCKPSQRARTSSTATNQANGVCLGALAGTTRPYLPAVTASAAPCFATGAGTILLPLFGTQVPLTNAQVAATYSGTPATGLAKGVLRGFLSQAEADATVIPSNQPLVGGKPLSALLAGGKNACPIYSDMDTDNGVPGWWFYFNFTANRVAWSESP